MSVRRLLEAPLTEITFHDIDVLIAEEAEEDLRLELKRELPANDRQVDPWMQDGRKIGNPARDGLAKEVVALANAYGGVIVVGVDETKDHPKRACGPDAYLIPRAVECAERLQQSLDQIIDPPLPMLSVRGVTKPGAPDEQGVLIIRVPASPRAPHGHGRPAQAYMRRGSRSEPMTMRDLQSVFFETRTRGEKVDRIRADRADKFQRLEHQRMTTGIRTPEGIKNYSYHCASFRCSAIPVDNIGIRAYDPNPVSYFVRPAQLTTPSIPGAFGQAPFFKPWRPRSGGAELYESGHNYLSRWQIDNYGMIEVAGFRLAKPYTSYDFVVTPDWFTVVAAQVMAMVEQARMLARRPDVEYVLECQLINRQGIVRAAHGQGEFDTPESIPDEEALIGPFSLGTLETFSQTFAVIEAEVWNAFGLQVRSPLAIDIPDWLRSIGRLPPLR